MKNQDELNALKKEFEALKAKLAELSEEEVKQVVGGGQPDENPENFLICPVCGNIMTRIDPLYEEKEVMHYQCKSCGHKEDIYP